MAATDNAQDPTTGQPSAAVTPPGQGFGNNTYNQIGDFFKGATGKDATQQQVSQWGTNVDPTYLNTIRNAIYNTPEAQAYAKSQSTPATPAAPTDTPTTPTTPAATGSPVTATGGIPPAQPSAPPPTPPAPTGQAPNQIRYVTPEDLSKVPAYQAAQLSQFSAPNQGANDASQSALMQAILANPGTMNPQVVAQLKEAQKEEALSMAGQNQSTMDQGNVASGRLGSGQAEAASQNNRQQAINAILTGNRNTDVTAASTNRSDQLNALGASSSLAQDQLGRAINGYTTTLGGQQAQASENYKAEQDGLNRILAQFGINTGVANNAQQNYSQDLASQLQAFQQSLQTSQFGENQRQFNDTLGYNYNALDQNGQNSLLQYLSQYKPA